MKTRTLLLLSVGCGLAILVAGMVVLLQLAGQPTPAAPLAVGSGAQAGDLHVVVESATLDATGKVVQVEITWAGTDDVDAAIDFSLVAPGLVARPDAEGTTCGASTVAASRCTLAFEVAAAEGTARQLVLERAGEKVRWSLTV